MIEVASLVAALGLESGAFTRGMAEAESRAHAGAGKIGLALGAIGVGAAAILAGSLKEATNYQTLLVNIQSNTGMTNAEIARMSTGIQDMAARTGAPLDQLAEAFMHIHNFGFSAADAMNILKPAMESALSTGDSVADVASTLGVSLHEFHLQASQAAVAMNVLHLAAQEGNATLGQFVEGTTQAFNMAGSYRVSLVDVAAALSTLTQSGQTARMASMGLSSAFQGIVKPTSASASFIQTLSKATGIDLVRDFSAAGLHARGFANIMDDVHAALGKAAGNQAVQSAALKAYSDNLLATHVSHATYIADMAKMTSALADPAQATNALFANVRAAREVMLLTGSQVDSFTQHLKDMGAAMAGSIDPTAAGFARQQATLAASLAKFHESITVMAISIGSALLPPLVRLMDAIQPVVSTITTWVRAHGDLTAALLGGVAAVGLLAGGMTVLELVLGPVAGLIAALGAPLLLIGGAIAGLAVAWTHDWGGIRETATGAWVAIQPILHALGDAVGETAAAFRRGGLGAAAETGLSEVQRLLAGLGTWITTTAFPDLATRMGNLAGAFWGWVQTIPSLLPQLATWLGHIKDWITGPAWKTVHDHVATWGQALVNWVAPRIGPTLGQLGLFLDTVGGWIAGALHTVVTHLALWGQALVNWVAPRIGPLLAQLGQLKDRVGAWLGGELPVIRAAVVGWAAELASLGTKAWSGLQPTLRTLGNGIITWMNDRTNEIRTNTTKWANAFADWVDPAKSKIPGKLDGFTAAVTAWVNSKGMQAMANLGSALGDALLAALGEVLKRKAAAAFSGFLPQNWLKNWTDILGGNTALDIAKFGFNQGAGLGDAISKGISGAIGQGIPGTKAAIKKHLDDTHTHARAAVKATSPSRVYWDLGHDMMAGLALGITDNAKLVHDALAKVLTPTGVAGGRGAFALGGAGSAGRTAGQNLFTGAGAFALPPLAAAGGGGVGSGPLTINVYTTPQGGVSVQGGSGDEHEFARQLGEFAQQMLTSQRRAGRGAARTLPGAR